MCLLRLFEQRWIPHLNDVVYHVLTALDIRLIEQRWIPHSANVGCPTCFKDIGTTLDTPIQTIMIMDIPFNECYRYHVLTALDIRLIEQRWIPHSADVGCPTCFKDIGTTLDTPIQTIMDIPFNQCYRCPTCAC